VLFFLFFFHGAIKKGIQKKNASRKAKRLHDAGVLGLVARARFELTTFGL
jgi:hypothetical protein